MKKTKDIKDLLVCNNAHWEQNINKVFGGFKQFIRLAINGESKGKKPIGRAWTDAEYEHCLTFKEAINTLRVRNVGFRAGRPNRSGVCAVCIDVDTAKESDSGKTYLTESQYKKMEQSVLAEVRKTIPLEKCVLVKSGGRGLHIIAFTKGVCSQRNTNSYTLRVGKKKWNFEFLNKGRQFVFGHSLHPNTNRRYEFVYVPAKIETISDEAVAEFFLTSCTKREKKHVNNAGDRRANSTGKRDSGTLEKFGRGESNEQRMIYVRHGMKHGWSMEQTYEHFLRNDTGSRLLATPDLHKSAFVKAWNSWEKKRVLDGDIMTERDVFKRVSHPTGEYNTIHSKYLSSAKYDWDRHQVNAIQSDTGTGKTEFLLKKNGVIITHLSSTINNLKGRIGEKIRQGIDCKANAITLMDFPKHIREGLLHGMLEADQPLCISEASSTMSAWTRWVKYRPRDKQFIISEMRKFVRAGGEIILEDRIITTATLGKWIDTLNCRINFVNNTYQRPKPPIKLASHLKALKVALTYVDKGIKTALPCGTVSMAYCLRDLLEKHGVVPDDILTITSESVLGDGTREKVSDYMRNPDGKPYKVVIYTPAMQRGVDIQDKYAVICFADYPELSMPDYLQAMDRVRNPIARYICRKTANARFIDKAKRKLVAEAYRDGAIEQDAHLTIDDHFGEATKKQSSFTLIRRVLCLKATLNYWMRR